MNNPVLNAVISSKLIHIPQPQSAEPGLIELAEGHLIKATVQRVADEMALLNFGGKSIMVRTDVPLEPQQRVLLQVTTANANNISFQIVNQASPSTTDGQPASLTLPPGNLQSLLLTWGLEPDPINQNIAKSIFAQSHTLTPESIQTVRTMWQTLPTYASLPSDNGGQVGNLDALVYLHTNKLPINSESLLLAKHWLNNALPIAHRLTNLQQTLQTVQTRLQSLIQQTTSNTAQSTETSIPLQPQNGQAAAAPIPQPLTNLLSTVNATLSQMTNWSISADTPTGEIAARLANLITNLGTPPESHLANQANPQAALPPTELANGGEQRGLSPATPAVAQQATKAAPQTQPTNGASAPQPAAANPAPQPAEPFQMPASAHSQPGPASEQLNPLPRLAAAIHQALDNPNLDQPTAHALRQLSTQLEAVVKDLGAIQLSNLTHPAQPLNEPYYMFPVPLQTPQGPQTAQLRVYRRYGHSSVDPDNLRLALLLDLPELGEIAVNLTVFEQHLSGKIFSGKETTHQRVENSLDELYHNLKNLGYHIDSLRADRLSDVEKREFDRSQPAETIEVPMQQINITA